MTVQVRENAGLARYEALVDGEVAGFAEYHDRAGRRVFTHTEVDPAHEGQGIGGALAREALDDVRRRGMAVVPLCPFFRSWIDRHPDYADLVAAS